MRLRTILLVTAVFFVVNAVVALVVPAVQLSLYGVTAGPGERYMAQWAGLGSLAVGLLALALRDTVHPKARRAVVLALLIYFVVGAAVSVLGTVSGVMAASGWSLVAMYLLFATGYGYLLVRASSGQS